MKKLFLASEIDVVAQHIAQQIPDVKKLKTAFITTGVEPSGGDASWFVDVRED